MRAGGYLLLCLCLAAIAAPSAAVGFGLAPVQVAGRHHGLTSSRVAERRPRGLTPRRAVKRRHREKPQQVDSDGDGFSDAAEILAGTDPHAPNATPNATPAAGGAGTSHVTGGDGETEVEAGPETEPEPAPEVEPEPAPEPEPELEVPVDCTTNLEPGADVAAAVESATGGDVICLQGGSYPRLSLDGVHKSPPVTLRSGGEGRAAVAGIALTDPEGLQFAALAISGGVTVTPSGSEIAFLGNDISGVAGIYMFGDFRIGQSIERVWIEGNRIHDIDYSGSQETGYGYGIEGVGDVRRMTIRNNTIKSTASDYIQAASPVDWVVDHNTFLGPSLLGSHEDHQDLWQIFGGGQNITFTDNVARDTETQESLLFQEGSFSNVVIENNLFDHDSRGYTCQIYQSAGLVFRRNTVVGSHWGCLFRDLASAGAGSGYRIDHNVFAETEANSDISAEGRAAGWGTYDYNVSSDDSAGGAHSVRAWKPAWADTIDYLPLGLSFAAGYRP